jgi:hypothetical protein
VTYAPWFNPPYYFQGYRHFFDVRRQLAETLRDLRALASIFSRRLVLYVLLLALLLRWRKGEDQPDFYPNTGGSGRWQRRLFWG